MKKTLIALAAIAAVSAAQAEVTLYGVIDIGVQSVSNGLSSDGNNPSNSNFYPSTKQSGTTGRLTSMTNGGLTPSRFGLKGSENLGDGLKANFVLEGRIQPNSGNTPNDHMFLAAPGSTSNNGAGDSSINNGVFNSQTTLGLSGGFGSIDFGYQLDVLGSAYGDNDPLIGGYISPLGTYGGATGMGSSFSGRASNSIKYKTTLGTARIGAFYAMGGASGNAGAGSQMGLSLGAALAPGLDVTFVAQKMNDNVSFDNGSVTVLSTATTTANGVAAAAASGTTVGVPAMTATYFNSTSASLMGNYQATPTLKLYAGYTSIVQSNPSNGTYDATITQNGGIPIVASAYAGINVNAYSTNLTTTWSWLGAKYDVSPTSHIMAGYYVRSVSSYTKNVTSATDQQAYASGHQNVYAAIYDMDLSKQADVYVYADMTNYDNSGLTKAPTSTLATPAASTATAASQWGTLAGLQVSAIGAGLRLKF